MGQFLFIILGSGYYADVCFTVWLFDATEIYRCQFSFSREGVEQGLAQLVHKYQACIRSELVGGSGALRTRTYDVSNV